MISIALDGIDFCGKSTQIKRIKKVLEIEWGLNVIATRAIGSELHPATEKLRDIALNSNYKLSPTAQQLVFAVNSLIFKQEVLEKTQCDILLMDRGYYSFHAYGLPLVKDQTWLTLVSDFIGQNKPQDITIYLDIDPDVAQRRSTRRKAEIFVDGGHDAIEAFGLGYQKEVRAKFLEFVDQSPKTIIRIDVLEKSEEELTNEILNNSTVFNMIRNIS